MILKDNNKHIGKECAKLLYLVIYTTHLFKNHRKFPSIFEDKRLLLYKIPVMKKIFLSAALTLWQLYLAAQVPVSKEPMHHNVFENAYVRVLDVHIKPGDTTQYHKHETPSVFIMLTPVKTGSQVIQEEKRATILQKDASITFEGFYITPRIHRVWNEDSREFHVMDVEILNKEPHTVLDTLTPPFQLLFNEKPVIGYRLDLAGKGNLSFQKTTAMLVVSVTDMPRGVMVNNKLMSKKGDYLFIPSNEKVLFKNNNENIFSFAVLQFK